LSEKIENGVRSHHWEDVYQWLVKIDKKYGLSRKEFEYYCKIPVLTPSSGRVFYPYYVLSKP
jgi:hypothetical protein